VTGYKAYCKISGGTNSTANADATATSAIIGDGPAPNQPLEQGKTYLCGVYAFNEAGDGPAGEDPNSFKTDVLISVLGNGVPQNIAYPTWDLNAWYSGDTSLAGTYITGLFYTMPVYFGTLFPPSAWTTANDDIISNDFISFTDTASLAQSDNGYVFMTNAPQSSTIDKSDLINWFGNDTSSVIPLSILYSSAGSFNVEFRAAVTPANTVLRYSIKTICQVAGGTATPSLVYRFQHTDESFTEYPYDRTSEFAIFWSTSDAIPGGPANGQFIGLDGNTGSEETDQYSYEYWVANTSNDVLKDCLQVGAAFGSGFGIGPINNEQSLKVDWLEQSFTHDGARINFVQPAAAK
jgi:hypothetical protein